MRALYITRPLARVALLAKLLGTTQCILINCCAVPILVHWENTQKTTGFFVYVIVFTTGALLAILGHLLNNGHLWAFYPILPIGLVLCPVYVVTLRFPYLLIA